MVKFQVIIPIITVSVFITVPATVAATSIKPQLKLIPKRIEVR